MMLRHSIKRCRDGRWDIRFLVWHGWCFSKFHQNPVGHHFLFEESWMISRKWNMLENISPGEQSKTLWPTTSKWHMWIEASLFPFVSSKKKRPNCLKMLLAKPLKPDVVSFCNYYTLTEFRHQTVLYVPWCYPTTLLAFNLFPSTATTFFDQRNKWGKISRESDLRYVGWAKLRGLPMKRSDDLGEWDVIRGTWNIYQIWLPKVKSLWKK